MFPLRSCPKKTDKCSHALYSKFNMSEDCTSYYLNMGHQILFLQIPTL